MVLLEEDENEWFFGGDGNDMGNDFCKFYVADMTSMILICFSSFTGEDTEEHDNPIGHANGHGDLAHAVLEVYISSPDFARTREGESS